MTTRPYTFSVFIATSLDGFIARTDGDIGWLTGRGPDAGDTGYQDFIDSVDTVVIGRKTYEQVLAFGREQWPYDGKQVAVLSTRLDPASDPRITGYGNLADLTRGLLDAGAKHVYADGGQVIQSLLRAGLLDELTVTTIPVLLGTGIPLFGPLDGDVTLGHRETTVLGAGFVQSRYTVEPADPQ